MNEWLVTKKMTIDDKIKIQGAETWIESVVVSLPPTFLLIQKRIVLLFSLLFFEHLNFDHGQNLNVPAKNATATNPFHNALEQEIMGICHQTIINFIRMSGRAYILVISYLHFYQLYN